MKILFNGKKLTSNVYDWNHSEWPILNRGYLDEVKTGCEIK